jgi:hypothetical protein
MVHLNLISCINNFLFKSPKTIFIFILFSWYHNNTERQSQSDDRSTMILNNVQPHHVGTYTCFASNLFGNASANIELIVTSMLK